MFLESEKLSTPELYKLLVGGVLPRPIAWVSSQNASGISNLAPYSFFTVASCNPPVLSITHINPLDRLAKDTFLNIEATGECVINIVSSDLSEQMNASCADYAADISEFEVLGVESVISQTVDVPGVKASKVRYECRLREMVTISEQPMSGIMILLDVCAIYIDDQVYIDSEINAKLLDVVGKLGGNDYVSTREQFTMERPKL